MFDHLQGRHELDGINGIRRISHPHVLTLSTLVVVEVQAASSQDLQTDRMPLRSRWLVFDQCMNRIPVLPSRGQADASAEFDFVRSTKKRVDDGDTRDVHDAAAVNPDIGYK